jgi:RNA polymerase sigma-70 factor, ECF subfamily
MGHETDDPGDDLVDELSELLARARVGDPKASEALFVRVYAHLRSLAGTYFRGKAASHTLQPTALVHEAFLRLMRRDGGWEDRNHFIAVAATAMRQILTDHARRRSADKRGGGQAHLSLGDWLPGDAAVRGDAGAVDALAMDDALKQLALMSPRQVRIVELRCFGGLTVEEAAEVLSLSRATVEREWRLARAWLRSALLAGDAGGDDDGA